MKDDKLLSWALAPQAFGRRRFVAGAVAGRVSWDARGQATIRLMPGVVHGENVAALIEAISEVVGASATKT